MKFAKNLIFYFQFNFTKKYDEHIVILALAPYDKKIFLYKKISSLKKIIYFTSWPYWDNSKYPKRNKIGKKFFKKKWKHFLENDSTKIVTVTSFAKQSLCDNFNIKKEVSVIPHSYNSEYFYPRKNKPSLDNKEIKILYIGRFEKGKGFENLIQAKSQVNDKFHFTMIGDGKLREFAINDSFSQDIKFIKEISDKNMLAEIISASDLLILPSYKVPKWEELFGMVLIEAMACGTPVVSTDCVGPKEIIQSNKNGLLIKQNSILEIVKVLKLYENQKENFLEYASNALEYVKYFELNHVSSKWEQLLDDY
ncbi:glycosyltransferase family 4 protein [Spirochaeta cellobiosiphila]|uniref:glycosyltransferase family 4 protein n=1 Tax=Spirochaeta cellobiosiphila TaxID=504483 RepID=UPI00146CBFBC|nr:glycosyltransferase family 4 protein [Spirochaeta cellobiosiphila]